LVVEPPRRLGMLRRRRGANLLRFGGGGGGFCFLIAVLSSSGLSCGDGVEEARGRFGLELEITVLASDDPRDKKRPIGLIGEVGVGVEVVGLGLGLRGSEGDVEIDGGREGACEARENAEGCKRECVRFGETVKKRDCANARCCTHFPLPIFGAQLTRIKTLLCFFRYFLLI